MVTHRGPLESPSRSKDPSHPVLSRVIWSDGGQKVEEESRRPEGRLSCALVRTTKRILNSVALHVRVVDNGPDREPTLVCT